MRRPLASALVLLSLLALSRCTHATRAVRPVPAGAATLRVLTWNVNFGLPPDAEALETLAASGADVVFLQETTAAWEEALRDGLGTAYPHQAWVRAPAAGGLAVLSRRPLSAREVLKNPGGWFPALRVVTHTPVGPLQALVVHLHPPVTEDGSWVRGYLSTGGARRAEVEHFLAALQPGMPTLVVGDFNEGTSGPAVQLLEAKGLRTALPEFSPDAKTWRWPVGPLLLSAQLDHVAYSRELEPLGARVERRGASDHLPVSADFVRAAPSAVRPPAPSGTSLSVSLSHGR